MIFIAAPPLDAAKGVELNVVLEGTYMRNGLPQAATCFSQIRLPRADLYPNFQTFTDWLEMAISEASGLPLL